MLATMAGHSEAWQAPIQAALRPARPVCAASLSETGLGRVSNAEAFAVHSSGRGPAAWRPGLGRPLVRNTFEGRGVERTTLTGPGGAGRSASASSSLQRRRLSHFGQGKRNDVRCSRKAKRGAAECLVPPGWLLLGAKGCGATVEKKRGEILEIFFSLFLKRDF